MNCVLAHARCQGYFVPPQRGGFALDISLGLRAFIITPPGKDWPGVHALWNMFMETDILSIV